MTGLEMVFTEDSIISAPYYTSEASDGPNGTDEERNQQSHIKESQRKTITPREAGNSQSTNITEGPRGDIPSRRGNLPCLVRMPSKQ